MECWYGTHFGSWFSNNWTKNIHWVAKTWRSDHIEKCIRYICGMFPDPFTFGHKRRVHNVISYLAFSGMWALMSRVFREDVGSMETKDKGKNFLSNSWIFLPETLLGDFRVYAIQVHCKKPLGGTASWTEHQNSVDWKVSNQFLKEAKKWQFFLKSTPEDTQHVIICCGKVLPMDWF